MAASLTKRFRLSILLERILNKRLNVRQYLMPHDCLLCGSASGQTLLCGACVRALPHHTQAACPRCALPTPDGEICGRCLAAAPAYDRTVAAFDYRYPLAEMLHAFKYGGQFAAGRFLAEALLARVQGERWPDVLFPMPLHPKRLQERGFNQAAEIARRLAIDTGLPISLDSLIKLRDTAPQASLPWKERQANVKGAFACIADVAGRRVVIVDDVMTTGTTLNEAAKALKKRGAAEVAVWVVARTLSEPGDH
jgi:ComF family protein